MPKSQFVACLVIAALLAACGKDEESATAGGETETAARDQARELAARAEGDREPESSECGKGGTECPAGLECLTLRGGEQACGPMAVDSSVLIKDATLGGSCVFSNPADSHPGASIASLQIIAVDGSVKGHGRLVWDKAGFEVAAERGAAPDGKEFRGDACTSSYNLGCDGQAVFEIVGDDGQVQKLREGEMVIVHLRGQESCGEEVADEVEAAICNDPSAAASGNLASCTTKVRMVQARSDLYGSDRVGGTINFLTTR